MTCKIFYAISISGNFYSLCPAIFVLLLSLFSCHGQKSSLSTASSFLTKDSSNGFLLFTDISTSSGARCKGIFNSLLSLFPPWIRPHSVGGAVLWLSSSLREPPRPRPSCPAGIFLRSLCFLSQSKQLFHGGFQRSLVSSFQAALRLLVSLGCSFGCFSFLIFALFFWGQIHVERAWSHNVVTHNCAVVTFTQQLPQTALELEFALNPGRQMFLWMPGPAVLRITIVQQEKCTFYRGKI